MTGDQEQRPVSVVFHRAVNKVLRERGSLRYLSTHHTADMLNALEAEGYRLVRADAVSSPDTDRHNEGEDRYIGWGSDARSSSVPSREEEQPIWQPRCFNCDVTRAEKRATQARVEALEAALRGIADGEVQPEPDPTGWYSTAWAIRQTARRALADSPASPSVSLGQETTG